MEQIGLTPVFFNQKITPQPDNGNTTPHQVQQNFSTMLSEALNTVNEAQVASDRQTEKLINGEAINLHDVMIAAEKASVTLQVTLEVRNKVIEAYQEVMRMPL